MLTHAAVAASLFTLAAAGQAGRGDGEVVRIVNLEQDAAGFASLAAEFAERNPGYTLAWHAESTALAAADETRVVFVQTGESPATVRGADGGVVGRADPDLTVGDMVLLRPGQSFEAGSALGLLVFTSPDPLPEGLPATVRPDWDEHITDVPGGCATETGAYRRVCLTWLRDNGRYNYHALNAHRVRITDSFTHYHPLEGGFDEFYLVQMVQPGARIIVSDQTERIVDPGSVESAEGLLHEFELEVGDLVYLPRGVIHRGVGGVLAHVITTPGFIPGAEIGVDHCLCAINERLGLEGDEALPLHEAGAAGPIVR